MKFYSPFFINRSLIFRFGIFYKSIDESRKILILSKLERLYALNNE